MNRPILTLAVLLMQLPTWLTGVVVLPASVAGFGPPGAASLCLGLDPSTGASVVCPVRCVSGDTAECSLADPSRCGPASRSCGPTAPRSCGPSGCAASEPSQRDEAPACGSRCLGCLFSFVGAVPDARCVLEPPAPSLDAATLFRKPDGLTVGPISPPPNRSPV